MRIAGLTLRIRVLIVMVDAGSGLGSKGSHGIQVNLLERGAVVSARGLNEAPSLQRGLDSIVRRYGDADIG